MDKKWNMGSKRERQKVRGKSMNKSRGRGWEKGRVMVNARARDGSRGRAGPDSYPVLDSGSDKTGTETVTGRGKRIRIYTGREARTGIQTRPGTGTSTEIMIVTGTGICETWILIVTSISSGTRTGGGPRRGAG